MMTTTSDARRLSPIAEAAKITRTPERTISRLANRRRIGAEKRDGVWFVDLDDLWRYVRDRAAKNRQPMPIVTGESAGESSGERGGEVTPDAPNNPYRSRILEAEDLARLTSAEAQLEVRRREAARSRRRMEEQEENDRRKERIELAREEIATQAELEDVRQRSKDYAIGIARKERRSLLAMMVCDRIIDPELADWYLSIPIDEAVHFEPKNLRQQRRKLDNRVRAARRALDRSARRAATIAGARRGLSNDEIDIVFFEIVAPFAESLIADATDSAEHGDMRALEDVERNTDERAKIAVDAALAAYRSGF
jgi:hypothetical protein